GVAAEAIGISDGDLEYSDESPNPEWQSSTSDDGQDDHLLSREEMLERLERGDTDYRLRSSIQAALADASQPFVDRALGAVSGTDDEVRFMAVIARRRHERRETDEAWSAATAVLDKGTARDW